MTTLRPLGPSVTLTALARMSTPRIKLSRASRENFTSFAAMVISSGSIEFSAWLEGRRQAFLRLAAVWLCTTPITSLSFMMRSSSPSSLISVPDHLPNRMRSPTFRSIGISLPLSSRPPGPTAITSPSCGFSLAVGDDDPPLGFFFRIDALDNDTIVQRAKFHERPPLAVSLCSAEPIALARKKFGVHRRSVKGRRRKNQHSPLDAANKLISFCFLERLLHGRVGDGNIPDVQSLEKPHGQRRLPPPARGFRSDDSQHPVPHAGPSRHPAKLHLAAARSSSPFPRTEEIPRLLVARTRRPPPFGDRRSLSADQTGRVQGDRRRVPAELTARRAAGRTPLAPGPEVVDRSLRPIRIHRGDASIVTPQDSRNLRICCPEDIAFDLGFIDEA